MTPAAWVLAAIAWTAAVYAIGRVWEYVDWTPLQRVGRHLRTACLMFVQGVGWLTIAGLVVVVGVGLLQS
jgi:hypothetical protein